MSRKITPDREPKVGLDEAVNSQDGSLSPQSSYGQKNRHNGLKVFGLGSLLCLLLLGMFSVGFVLGQEWGQRKSDLHWMSINLKNEERLPQLSKASVAAVTAIQASSADDIKSALSQMHELGEELKHKLISTHDLYAGLVGLPEQLRNLERLMMQWDANKISLVEDPCPASDNLPRILPSHVKTATK